MQWPCKLCGQPLFGDAARLCEFLGVREQPPKYAEDAEMAVFQCPHCGAKNEFGKADLSQMFRDAHKARLMAKPLTKKIARDEILKILRRMYPTRTGYNGGHLAPVRDVNPDVFFEVLSELEKEGVIEYNDTNIVMRLSDTYMKEHGKLQSAKRS